MELSFDDFIIANSERINQIANELSNFEVDAKKIGIKEAKRRVRQWIENFHQIGFNNLELPLYLLEKRDFIDSNHISDKLIKDADSFIKDPSAYICPLGETNESSFKITSKLHKNERFHLSLSELLNNPGFSFNGKILMFDDFLNSGGQLVSIFYALLNQPLPNGEINDESDSRSNLTTSQILKLKSAEIHIFYYHAFTEGVKKVEERLINELELKIIIHSHYSTNNNDGVFGDAEEQEKIEESAEGKLKNKSIFQGKEYAEIKDFYLLLKTVGTELLKFKEPQWSNVKYANRALGYGNLCRVIITDSNIPTITLTAIWQNGLISINGIEIDWKELLPRTKKVIKKSALFKPIIQTDEEKTEPDIEELNALKELYNSFYLKEGCDLSDKIIDKYPQNKNAIRWWALFHNRRMEWNLVKDVLSKKIADLSDDELIAECYLGIFESCLNIYTRDRHQSNAFIKLQEEKVQFLEKVPNKITNGKYHYFLARFLEEEWWLLSDDAKQSTTILYHSSENITMSIDLYRQDESGYSAIDSKPWWLYCHKAMLLKLWNHDAFLQSLNEYGDIILNEIEINHTRRSIQMYAITFYILKDSPEELDSFLEKLNSLENSKKNTDNHLIENNKISTVDNLTYHYIEIIYYNDAEKKKLYHKKITEWFQKKIN